MYGVSLHGKACTNPRVSKGLPSCPTGWFCLTCPGKEATVIAARAVFTCDIVFSSSPQNATSWTVCKLQ